MKKMFVILLILGIAYMPIMTTLTTDDDAYVGSYASSCMRNEAETVATSSDSEDLTLSDIFEYGRTFPALENLVENGDFSDGTTGWTDEDDSEIAVENETLKVSNTTNSNYYARTHQITGVSVDAGDQIHVNFYAKTGENLTSGDIRLYMGSSALDYDRGYTINTDGNWEELTAIFDITEDISDLEIRITAREGSSDSVHIFYIDNVVVSNLTKSHGITDTSTQAEKDSAVADIEMALDVNDGHFDNFGTDEFDFQNKPTQAQMDEWLNEYLDNKENERTAPCDYQHDVDDPDAVDGVTVGDEMVDNLFRMFTDPKKIITTSMETTRDNVVGWTSDFVYEPMKDAFRDSLSVVTDALDDMGRSLRNAWRNIFD